jgi:hypothetical protein
MLPRRTISGNIPPASAPAFRTCRNVRSPRRRWRIRPKIRAFSGIGERRGRDIPSDLLTGLVVHHGRDWAVRKPFCWFASAAVSTGARPLRRMVVNPVKARDGASKRENRCDGRNTCRYVRHRRVGNEISPTSYLVHGTYRRLFALDCRDDCCTVSCRLGTRPICNSGLRDLRVYSNLGAL